jgi:hypothetical protein
MGSAQLASLSVRIKGSSGIGGGGSGIGIGVGGGDIEVAVIFAEPTAQELDYLFGNKNLTRYVLQLISNSGLFLPPAVRPVLPENTGASSLFSGEENGFLDSLDYISHLKAELAAGGNLDIAAVKDEIKMEDIPEALLAPASLPTTNGAVVSAEDDRRDDNMEDDDYIDEDFVIPDSDRSDHEDNRKRRTRTRRLTRGREAKRSRLKERAAGSDTEQEGEEGGVQADKKIWPYVKVIKLTGFGASTYWVLRYLYFIVSESI